MRTPKLIKKKYLIGKQWLICWFYHITRITDSLKHFKKDPGSDGINKHAPSPPTVTELHSINMCWKIGYIPNEWKITIVLPTHKKLNRTNCGNYQEISLLNICCNIYSKVMPE